MVDRLANENGVANARYADEPTLTNGHGKHDGEYTRQPAWRNLVEHFTPTWFVLPMNTGILGIILHQLPYQFRGAGVLSTIFYVFDLLLFVVFGTIIILRLVLYSQSFKKACTSNIDELSMLGAIPIAFLTITALTALIPSNASWGGHGFTILAYVMWWFGTAWMVATCIAVPVTAFQCGLIDGRTMTPTIFIPVVGVATDATVGGLIVNYSYNVSSRLAVPVIVTALSLTGMAIWLSLILYAIYFHKLFATGLPPAASLPSLLILVGPFGQTAGALINLGTAAMNDFGGYDRGTFLTASSGASLASASTMLALLILGLDYWLIIFSLYAILRAARKRQLSYSLAWWGTVFPLGTTCVAWLSLATALNSPTFRVLTTGLFLLILIDWFVNWGFTIYYSLYGKLLVKPQDEKEEKEA